MPEGEVKFCFILPPDVMRSLSVGEAAPSAVVANIKRPGISFVPGVPSTDAYIEAALASSAVPSAPKKFIVPNVSPL